MCLLGGHCRTLAQSAVLESEGIRFALIQIVTRLLCLLAILGAIPALLPFAASGSDPWANLRRPLRVPHLAPGAPCPVTPATSTKFGLAQGKGPVWPVLGFPQLSFFYPVRPQHVY